MNTRVVTTHISTELAEKLDQFSEQLDRPKAWIIKEALTDWIEHEEYRHQMTLEGLDDIDAGRVTEHSVMKAWTDSMGKSWNDGLDKT